MIAAEFDLRKVRNNDPKVTSLRFNLSATFPPGECFSVKHVEACLQSNTHLKTIVVFLDASLVSPNAGIEISSKYGGVLKSLGQLPSLTCLHFSSGPKARGILPVRVLIPLLQETQHLKTLLLSDLDLSGTKQDFDDLAAIMHRLWYLEYCSFTAIELYHPSRSTSGVVVSPGGGKEEIGGSTSASSSSLSGVIISLSMLPSLRTLTLTTTKKTQTTPCIPTVGISTNRSLHSMSLSESAASALFLSSSIKTLTLQNWTWTPAHLISMARLLRSNTALQVLDLSSLSVSVDIARALAVALQDNVTLRVFKLELTQMLSNDTALILAQSLRTQSGLHSLELTGHRLGRVSKSITMAFKEMLQSNFVLRQCLLFRKSFLKPTIEYYTRLNAMGREKVLKVEDTTMWMRVLSHSVVQEDLNNIYYFLSSNPTLCMRAASDSGKKSTTLDKRCASDQAHSNKRAKLQ